MLRIAVIPPRELWMNIAERVDAFGLLGERGEKMLSLQINGVFCKYRPTRGIEWESHESRDLAAIARDVQPERHVISQEVRPLERKLLLNGGEKICKFAGNSDPLRGIFASNSDPF